VEARSGAASSRFENIRLGRVAAVSETSAVLDPEHLREELILAGGDAGIAPASIVGYVVTASRPAGTTPLAYLHPEGLVWPETVAVFRAVGAARVARHQGAAHRLAIWGELPGIPDCALGPMLRHELEHARRWERSGTRFYEADDLLRAAVRGAGGHIYATLPSEVEANAASAAYAERTLSASDLAKVRACEECAALVAPGQTPPDVVAATLAELAARDDWGPDVLGRSNYLADVARDCATWDPATALGLVNGRTGPEIELV
jgi:hypothetical protein